MYALLAVNKSGEKHYQSIKKYDVDLFQDICEQVRHSLTFSPSYNVRPGFNTDQARGYNYNTWRDFFNKRQFDIAWANFWMEYRIFKARK